MQILSGVLLPLLLMGAGAFLTLFVGGKVWGGPRRFFCALRGDKDKSAARALTVALAGTLGVGNIAGVATAMLLGGAGAVFWMWVSALLAMLLKYAEILLAVKTRRFDAEGHPHGGAMYYIKDILGGRIGRLLAAAFAVLCLLCSVTLGGVIQSSAAAEAVAGVAGIPPLAVGLVMGGGAAFLLARGSERVEGACARLVPFVCLLFAVGAVAVILLRREMLPDAMRAIFQGAFSFRSGGAGLAGFLTAKGVRYGVTRGLISNEAGCGTAPIAHAASQKRPAEQGVWGIVEVFVDTVLLCTLTALVILVSGVPLVGEGGISLASSAFAAVLGGVAPPLLAVSVLIFAFATVLCWAHYGGECLYYLTGRRGAAKWSIPLVLLSCAVGSVVAPVLLWEITDLVVTLMAILNITAVLAAAGTVKEETKAYFDQ